MNQNTFFCFFLVLLINTTLFAQEFKPTCHPSVDDKTDQYIVGYGSLISEQSKRNTIKNVGDNIPIMLKDYQRGWFLNGNNTSFAGIFLGIKPLLGHQTNAVVFRLNQQDQLIEFDKREAGYCRVLVKEGQISILSRRALPKGQYWIYVPERIQMGLPSKKYPIMQSYVDIFLSGCLDMEKKYQLKGYARQCINLTSNWSSNWVNDRIYPRRPWVYVPEALHIDKLLSEEVKIYFDKIQIE